MFIVVPHIPSEGVERSVVRKRVLPLFILSVVLRQEVASARMQPSREPHAEEEVADALPSAQAKQRRVRAQLPREVEHVRGGDAFGFDENGPNRVREYLVAQPQELPRSPEHVLPLPRRRQVGVFSLHALLSMVGQVVPSERDCEGKEERGVKHAH